MIVLGGVTRLTHAGLSIVEWNLISGVLPPLDDAAWQQAFDAYKRFPEYQQLNRGMEIAEFKAIFWFEYAHRLLGRVVGAAFVLPLAYFLFTKRLGLALVLRLSGLFVVGGLQGALGWFMVASGLVDRPDVSHYRLTGHLGLAVILFGALLWVALDVRGIGAAPGFDQPTLREVGRRRLAIVALAMIFLTMLSGALVAGLDAGLVYNTFPLMDGKLVPRGLFADEPWYLNLFENRLTVQFNHRCLAVLTVALTIFVWSKFRRTVGQPKRLAGAVAGLAIVQSGIGIATLMLAVPVPVAALHQANAALLFAVALLLVHTLWRRKSRS